MSFHAAKPNHTKGELKAFAELRKDNKRTILTSDKGVEIVIMDRRENTDKANNLLAQPAYRMTGTQ